MANPTADFVYKVDLDALQAKLDAILARQTAADRAQAIEDDIEVSGGTVSSILIQLESG